MKESNVKVIFTVLEGGDKGKSYELENGITTIGRVGTDIRLRDKKVSGMHAQVQIAGDEVIIEDLQSRNGVVLNDTQVASAELRDKDIIRLGLTKFKVSIEDEAGTIVEEVEEEKEVHRPPPSGVSQILRKNIGPLIAEELKDRKPWDLSRPADQVISGKGMEPKYACGLEYVSGPEAGKKIRIQKRRTTLGRARADVVLLDEEVSRIHSEIEIRDTGKFIIRDMGSTNGTFVNAQKISEHELEANDQIQLGDSIFRFVTS